MSCLPEAAWACPAVCHDGIIRYEGEGCLCGGQTEEEAHEEIVTEFKKINSEIKVRTCWTYLDELPFEEYGSLEEDNTIV